MSQEKAADAFRTISEVAEELDLPQHVLRFWETRFPQIKPMKRGGGRRYYRPDDVELLRGIRYLLYVRGFTIRGVQKILKENGPRGVIAIGVGDLRGVETLQNTKMPDAVEPDPIDGEDRASRIASAEPRRGSLSNLLRRERGDERDGEAFGGSSDDVGKLNGVILELLELKRLLDQVR